MIDKDIIDKALNFYNIDLQYRDKCYNCVEEINKKEKLSLAFSKLYNKLYNEEFIKIKDLWQYKQQHNFDATQIKIHKKRVKEFFESDLKLRKKMELGYHKCYGLLFY